MDEQPPKRRKTSPSKATPVFTPQSERAAPRASFMSPTRASLSRFNPSLLPTARPASAGPVRRSNGDRSSRNSLPQQNPQDEVLARGHEALNFVMGGFNAAIQNAMATAQSYINSPTFAQNPAVAIMPTGEETDEQMEAMRAVIRARREQEWRESGRASMATRAFTPIAPLGASEIDDEDVDELSPEVPRAERPRQIPQSARARVEPRTFTPHASSEASGVDEQDIDELSPDIPRANRLPRRSISARPSVSSSNRAIPEVREQSEPLFIQDHDQDDLSPDIPRATDRRMERVATEETDLPETPEALRRQLDVEDHPPRGVLFSSPSKRRKAQTRVQESASPQEVHHVVEKHAAKPVAQQSPEAPAESKPTVAKSPEQLVKEDEKAKLEAELKTLREEVEKYEQFAQSYSSEEGERSDNFSALLKFIASSRTKESFDQDLPTLSSLLTSFLPFSVPVAGPPTPPASPDQQKPFVSHQPLKEKDPLPLNSLFTPLSITSTIHAPSTLAPNSKRLVQKHSITLASPGSLLSCSLDLSISSEPSSASEPSIESLVVTNLSSWADSDIGSWLEDRCSEGDIAAVGYGIGRYWDIVMKRAQCWLQCQKDFAHLVAGSSMSSNRKARTSVEDEQDSSAPTILSKRQILPQLGRQNLVLESPDVIFQVSWKLQFDWTGEVESFITAEAAVPETWREVDSKNALHKIPTTFDALMRERGVLQAVKVIASLLFDTE